MTSWETSFLAMSIALGASETDASSGLEPEGRARASGLVGALEDPSRANRARALASAIAAIVVDLEQMRLT
jgi:hypothetical protein